MAELNTNYDDAAATAEPEGGKYGLGYGVFDARVKEVVPAEKGATNFTIKTSKNGKQHYSARYIMEYKDDKGELKTKGAFIQCIGLWFPDPIKQLLEATGFDNPDGRAALMADTDAMIGKKLKIVITSRIKNEYGKRDTFKGFEVGEYDGKKFIANEIISIHKRTDKPVLDMAVEEELRKEFKDSGFKIDNQKERIPGEEVGFDEPATKETPDF